MNLKVIPFKPGQRCLRQADGVFAVKKLLLCLKDPCNALSVYAGYHDSLILGGRGSRNIFCPSLPPTHTEKIKHLTCYAVWQVSTNTLSVPHTMSVYLQQRSDDSLQLKSIYSESDHSGERSMRLSLVCPSVFLLDLPSAGFFH